MADQLYLSLWFPNFRLVALAPAIVGVLRQLASAGGASPVTAAAVYPISWNEAPVYQRVYDSTGEVEVDIEAAQPERAVAETMEMLHEDYAYEFEVKWDLWVPETGGGLDTLWRQEPRALRVTGFGPEFDEGSYEQNGHIRIDFGTDAPFLQEEVALTPEAIRCIEENIRQLIELTNAVEKESEATARLLWSELGESLASRLVARLNKLQ